MPVESSFANLSLNLLQKVARLRTPADALVSYYLVEPFYLKGNLHFTPLCLGLELE